MIEIRPAKTKEITSQKELWKLCFGDEDKYIDFYFANQYKDENTLLLLINNVLVSMLTMIPTAVITAGKQRFDSAMLYAIATHPQYQNRGYAAKLMNYTDQYLSERKKGISVLVPAEKKFFNFYRHKGYQESFFLREVQICSATLDSLPVGQSDGVIFSASPKEYNQRRTQQLEGRFYVAYDDQEILYQKELSQRSGADIYALDFHEVFGCAVLERINSEKMLIKEILLPEEYLSAAVKQIKQLIPAKEYVLRTPVWSNAFPGGSVRPFGMMKTNKEIDLTIPAQESGYLGLAFD